MKNVVCLCLGAVAGWYLACDFIEYSINKGTLDTWLLKNMDKRGVLHLTIVDEEDDGK